MKEQQQTIHSHSPSGSPKYDRHRTTKLPFFMFCAYKQVPLYSSQHSPAATQAAPPAARHGGGSGTGRGNRTNTSMPPADIHRAAATDHDAKEPLATGVHILPGPHRERRCCITNKDNRKSETSAKEVHQAATALAVEDLPEHRSHQPV